MRLTKFALFFAIASLGLLSSSCNKSDNNPENPKTGENTAPLEGLIFETNFDNDTGYVVQAQGLTFHDGGTGVQPPTNWDAGIATHQSRMETIVGAGENGGNALKYAWDPNAAQPTMRLIKHLTNDGNTGYEELFIRYKIKLPDNFQAGGPEEYRPYWKWGRLWQNVSAVPDATWTENRSDSGYVVWNTGGKPAKFSSVWQNDGPNNDLNKGSAGGEHQFASFFLSGADETVQDGYFESVGNSAWRFDEARPGYLLNKTQQYQTIEFHFKLASAMGAKDGVFEMFVDGEKWTPLSILPQYGSTEQGGLATYNVGSGWNMFILFDNMGGWNIGWKEADAEGYVLIDDIVISTVPIGADYVAGNIDNTSN